MSTIKPVTLNKMFVKKNEHQLSNSDLIVATTSDQIIKLKHHGDYSFSSMTLFSIFAFGLCMLADNLLLQKSK